MSPQAQTDDPMAISSLLNPSDYEDSIENGIPTRVVKVTDSMERLAISRPSNQANYFDHTRQSLPIRGIPRRHSVEQKSNWEGASFGHRLPNRHAHCSSHRPQSHSPRHRYSQSMSPPARSQQRAKNRPPHSNKAYTKEQVMWTKYMKEDCGFAWKAFPQKFRLQFPEECLSGDRLSPQCFSSRYYRDNDVPEHDANWEFIPDHEGRPKMRPAPVRQRTTPEGKVEGIPVGLVHMYPERCLEYPWVSREHKAEARKVIARDKAIDTGDVSPSQSYRWRKLLRYLEARGLL